VNDPDRLSGLGPAITANGVPAVVVPIVTGCHDPRVPDQLSDGWIVVGGEDAGPRPGVNRIGVASVPRGKVLVFGVDRDRDGLLIEIAGTRAAPPACVPRGLSGVSLAPRSSVELYPLGAPIYDPVEPDYGPPRTGQQLPHQPSPLPGDGGRSPRPPRAPAQSLLATIQYAADQRSPCGGRTNRSASAAIASSGGPAMKIALRSQRAARRGRRARHGASSAGASWQSPGQTAATRSKA
jgi:hypothetical protein